MATPHVWPWKLFNIVMRLAGLFTTLSGAVFLTWSVLLIVRAPIVVWAQGTLADPNLAAPLLFAAVWFSILGVGILRAPPYRPDLGDADRLVDPAGFKLRRFFSPSRSWWTGDRGIGTRTDDQGAHSGRIVQAGWRSTTPVAWEQLPRLRKGVVLAVWTLGIVSLLYKSYLYLDYGARMPHAPEQETGRVTPSSSRTPRCMCPKWSRHGSAQLAGCSWGALRGLASWMSPRMPTSCHRVPGGAPFRVIHAQVAIYWPVG
jgi:hypothetical protein